MMVVAAMAILCCTGCVLSQQYQQETHLHIRIYAPPGLLRNGSEVYFNMTKENTLNVEPGIQLEVHRYGKFLLQIIQIIHITLWI